MPGRGRIPFRSGPRAGNGAGEQSLLNRFAMSPSSVTRTRLPASIAAWVHTTGATSQMGV